MAHSLQYGLSPKGREEKNCHRSLLIGVTGHHVPLERSPVCMEVFSEHPAIHKKACMTSDGM